MSGTPPTGTPRKPEFRPEIEGLRAIAATLVAVFHIWLGRVSGGVDVFFVVSSFLITTGLLREIERNGAVRFAAFWARLVKRLLPAAMLVLLAVVIASLFLLPKSRWKDTIEEVAASGVYIENWVLAFKAVDYLAAQATASPVQHFWALSTQGQFYLVWPLLVAGVAFAARKAGVAFRKLAAVAFAIVFAVSLVASVILTQRDQPFTYFNTFARAWEFSLGALLAVFVSRIDLSRGLRVAAGWIGVLGILSCGLVLQVSRVFPGYAALWPILCAALVIIAGTSGSRFGVDRILASKPMVYVGGISYAIYLWHFPLLVFCRTYAQPYPISFATGVGILVASFVLAALTSRFLENPARYSSIGKESPLRAFAFGVACAVPLVIGLGFWSWRYVDARRDMRPPVALGDPQHPGVAALGQAGPQRWKAPLYPGPLEVAQDRDRMESRCGLDYESTVPGQCWAGVTENPRLTVAVVGSSYAAQWTPALELVAAQEQWRVRSFTKSNCPFYVGESVREGEFRGCAEWNANVLQEILRTKPDVVFTNSTRRDPTGREIAPAGFVDVWEILAKAGITVVAVRDNPYFNFDVSQCVELHGEQSGYCAKARKDMYPDIDPVSQLRPLPPNVKFIDLSDDFCDATTCHPVIGNVMVYRHTNHITATYIRTMAGHLLERMKAVLGGQPAISGAPTSGTPQEVGPNAPAA